MRIFGFILSALICLSLVMGGVPMQAAFAMQEKGAPCPMIMEQAKNIFEMPCGHCPDHQKEKTAKNNDCCADPVCNAKCSVSASKAFQTGVIGFSGTGRQRLEPFFVRFILPSLSGKVPERPPRFLS